MSKARRAAISAGEVFRNHLALRLAGCTAEDISSNYAEDVVLLCFDGAYRGRKAVRESARRLARQLPNARFELTSEIVEGPYAFLLWRAKADGCDALDGADSFVIRDGRIVMQSVYYRLEPSAHMPARFTPLPRASGERVPSAARRVRGL